ncbi:biotin transport system substrate-specific component [Selenomonas sp. WCT3]|uniref:biotin transporter BioY n=1 Tax=Selenomonas sp. WCT3 TaxID=3158785 RepID=UPI00088BACC7|nr:biotin transport system substrate-specific component [Selenomonas ruminantium]
MKKLKLREMIICALFIALITIGTFVRIPVGTDVYTLQFLFTLLAGLILGARLGAVAVIAYIVLGLMGVPVFASGGGPAYVLQPTFGYLLGFVWQAWFCGKFSRKLRKRSFPSLLVVNFGGMVIVYLLGISWFYFFSNYVVDAPIALWAAIFYCGILQAGPDFLLCMAAAGLALRCYRAGLWLMEDQTVRETSEAAREA